MRITAESVTWARDQSPASPSSAVVDDQPAGSVSTVRVNQSAGTTYCAPVGSVTHNETPASPACSK
ncbi:hypothetical protein [Clavibacter nebraskensis]|uniref:hypothetical protein n=1 Tax=Clavibacter nebraskensis TaxID=31963 RepID=UPI003DA073A7